MDLEVKEHEKRGHVKVWCSASISVWKVSSRPGGFFVVVVDGWDNLVRQEGKGDCGLISMSMWVAWFEG